MIDPAVSCVNDTPGRARGGPGGACQKLKRRLNWIRRLAEDPAPPPGPKNPTAVEFEMPNKGEVIVPTGAPRLTLLVTFCAWMLKVRLYLLF